MAPIANVDKFWILISKTFGMEVCIIWNVKPNANIENNIILAIKIKSLDELLWCRFSDLIFWKDICLLIIKIKRIIPTNIETIPGNIKATFQSKYFINKPAIKAPEPIPIPPKIPLMPSALPFLSEELTTQAINGAALLWWLLCFLVWVFLQFYAA